MESRKENSLEFDRLGQFKIVSCPSQEEGQQIYLMKELQEY